MRNGSLCRPVCTSSKSDCRHFSEFFLRVQPIVRKVPRSLEMFFCLKIFTIHSKSNKSLKLAVVFLDSCILDALSFSSKHTSFFFFSPQRVFIDSLLGPSFLQVHLFQSCHCFKTRVRSNCKARCSTDSSTVIMLFRPHLSRCVDFTSIDGSSFTSCFARYCASSGNKHFQNVSVHFFVV